MITAAFILGAFMLMAGYRSIGSFYSGIIIIAIALLVHAL